MADDTKIWANVVETVTVGLFSVLRSKTGNNITTDYNMHIQ